MFIRPAGRSRSTGRVTLGSGSGGASRAGAVPGQRSRLWARSADGQKVAGARSKGRSTSRVGGPGPVGRVRQRGGEVQVGRGSNHVTSADQGPGRASRQGRRRAGGAGRHVLADLTSAFRSAVAWSPASGEAGGSSGCGAGRCGRESVTAAQVGPVRVQAAAGPKSVGSGSRAGGQVERGGSSYVGPVLSQRSSARARRLPSISIGLGRVGGSRWRIGRLSRRRGRCRSLSGSRLWFGSGGEGRANRAGASIAAVRSWVQGWMEVGAMSRAGVQVVG